VVRTSQDPLLVCVELMGGLLLLRSSRRMG
jgi:hypothetical protein